MAKNIVDKVTDDDTQIVVTTKSVKWVIGILVFCVSSILGFAWQLSVSIKSQMAADKIELTDARLTDKKEIMEKLEKLEREEVKNNTTKIHLSELDIVRLMERTAPNHNISSGPRTTTTIAPPALPTVGQ